MSMSKVSCRQPPGCLSFLHCVCCIPAPPLLNFPKSSGAASSTPPRKRKNIYDMYDNFIAPPSPLRVAITNVASEVGYALFPMIASGEMFGDKQPVIIHGYNVEQYDAQEDLRGITMELQDGHYPLLHGIDLMHTDLTTCITNADIVICLPTPRSYNSRQKDVVLETDILHFKHIGLTLRSASLNVKVLVTGPRSHTHCAVVAAIADLPPTSCTALSRLDLNRAKGQVIKYLRPQIEDRLHALQRLSIFGNAGGRTAFVDTTKTTIGSTPISHLCNDDINEESLCHFVTRCVQKRNHHNLAKFPVARAITQHMREWICGTDEGDWTCMGIIITEELLRKGVFPSYFEPHMVISLPVTCSNGSFFLLPWLIDEIDREVSRGKQLQESVQELKNEKVQALSFLR